MSNSNAVIEKPGRKILFFRTFKKVRVLSLKKIASMADYLILFLSNCQSYHF